ncbi:GAF and ANTAR domain-containing protein [Streptomonospora sp. S1-112]|uniref:GAF and ANTAR domain-containing protein n=1 Tax=Streptomonospora mangrovi TaxID=2883123 RepID=A0A9X3SFY3_9ACTN|nr:GAF and ANTAR domain-containing protein [Streptomonospora mangrovi]MDA0567373.1 GAF and ANTAR domain-containing protein [Streptomonospora mangrovi]
MESERQDRIWNLLADEARHLGGGISIDLVCSTTRRVLAVDGVAVTLIGADTAREVACATDQRSRRLEELQFMLGEGPCLESFALGAPVLASDLAAESARWPVFAPAAVDAGARSVFSFPLQFGAVAIGTFEVHRRAAGPLSGEELGNALVLADTVALLLLDSHGRDEGTGHLADAQPWLAPDYHTEVYQATGMLSVQLGIGLDDALARLRAHAFANELTVSAVAREILAGRLRLDEGDADG